MPSGGTETPRVAGSILSLGTTSKPASVKGLRSFNNPWNVPEYPQILWVCPKL